MVSLTPFLWFDDNLDDALNLYADVFDDVKVHSSSRNGETLFSAEFEILGQRFNAINGGPMYAFNESFSVQVHCDGQEEVDRYWDGLLSGGGTPSKCGWLKDRFGLSWQIIPRRLSELLGSPDPAAAKRAMDEMLTQSKLDIAALEKAAAG